jgi:hypothetical protein
MAMSFVKREAEPLGRRHAALICFAAATTGWALTLATVYASLWLLGAL